MTDFLSLHDVDRVVEDEAPAVRPGIARVFAGIIRDPDRTLADAFAHPIQAYALLFAAAGGVYWALNLAIAQPAGDLAAMPVLLAAILLIGLPAGVGYLFAITILLNWSCDILGGRATRKGIRMMLAYAGVPGLVALVLFGIPKLLVFGRELFLPERTWLQANPALVWGLWFGDAICFAWSLALVIKSLKILNGFSTGRAMLAAILPLGPIALIGLLFLAIVYGGILTAPPAF